MPDAAPERLLDGAAAHAMEAESVVWVAIDGRVTGFIALRDELLPGAAKAVADLRTTGRTALLLSGDSEATTMAVAGKLGIPAHRSRLTPEQKAEAIADGRASGVRVAMVGDGVNDAPALARPTFR